MFGPSLPRVSASFFGEQLKLLVGPFQSFLHSSVTPRLRVSLQFAPAQGLRACEGPRSPLGLEAVP